MGASPLGQSSKPKKPVRAPQFDSIDEESGAPIYGGPEDQSGVQPVEHESDNRPEESKNFKDWRDTWRVGARGAYKFDDAAKGRFLHVLATTSRFGHAAAAASISARRVYEVIKSDDEFAAAVQEAKDQYRDRAMQEVQRRGFEGVIEPIIGGMGKDVIVAFKRTFSDALLIMEAKRTNDDYRDKKDINLTHGGGIVAFPATMTSEELEEWAEQYEYPEEAPDPDLPEGTEV